MTATGEGSTPPPPPDVAAAQQLLHAALRLEAQAFCAYMRYQVETLVFLKERSVEEARLMDDLAASDDFNEAFDIVGTYAQAGMPPERTQADQFVLIGLKLAAEAVQNARDEVRRLIEARASGASS